MKVVRAMEVTNGAMEGAIEIATEFATATKGTAQGVQWKIRQVQTEEGIDGPTEEFQGSGGRIVGNRKGWKRKRDEKNSKLQISEFVARQEMGVGTAKW